MATKAGVSVPDSKDVDDRKRRAKSVPPVTQRRGSKTLGAPISQRGRRVTGIPQECDQKLRLDQQRIPIAINHPLQQRGRRVTGIPQERDQKPQLDQHIPVAINHRLQVPRKLAGPMLKQTRPVFFRAPRWQLRWFELDVANSTLRWSRSPMEADGAKIESGGSKGGSVKLQGLKFVRGSNCTFQLCPAFGQLQEEARTMVFSLDIKPEQIVGWRKATIDRVLQKQMLTFSDWESGFNAATIA